MLKIQFKDRRKPAMWLVDSTFVIGADSGNNIVIDDEGVAPRHAELVIQQDEILLKNVSQNRSVFINDVPIIKEQTLKAWDVIRLGKTELEIVDPLTERTPQPQSQAVEQKTVIRPAISPWMLKASSAPLDGQYFSLNNGTIIGREKGSDIIVPLSYVSRKHAQFAIKNEKLFVEDLGSSNGTYVNGERVKSCELFNGDEFRLDEFIFQLIGPAKKLPNKQRTIVRDTRKSVKKESAKPSKQPEALNGEASQRVFIHGISPEVSGKVYEISQRQNHLSRMLGHHLSTSEKSVSARHVYLRETDIGWEIKNDGASDGLLVNGKMQSKAILQDGDELVVGGTKLKFQSVGDKPLSYVNNIGTESNTGKVIIAVVVLGAIVAGVLFSGII